MGQRERARGPARRLGPLSLAAARSTPRPSTVACIGVCGYFVGLTLPLPAPFDLPLAFLIVLAVIAASVGLQQAKPPDTLVLAPVLVFVAARLLSATTAADPLRSVQTLAPFLPGLLLFFMLSEWVETRRQVIAICVCLTFTGFVLATAVIVGSWSGGAAAVQAWARAVPGPVLVVKNDVALAAVLAPLGLAAALTRRRRSILLAMLAFFVVLIAAIVLVQSRTALLTAIVAIAGFAALAGRQTLAGHRRLPLMLFAGIAAVAVGADAALGFGFLHKVLSDWHGSGRLALWAAALAMFRSAPLLGLGPGGYALHYRTHLDPQQFPAWFAAESRASPWPHNLYLEVLAEQGALGLLSFLVLAGMALVLLARIIGSHHAHLRCLGAGVGAAFMAFLTAGLFELSFLRVWVTIIFLTLFGLLVTISRAEQGGRQ